MTNRYCHSILLYLTLLVVGRASAYLAEIPLTNLGTMTVGEVRKLDVTVANASNAPLSVRAFVSSCECLRVLEWPSNIPPGGTAVVRTEVDAPKAGEFAYVLDLFSGSSNERPVFSFICDVTVEARASTQLSQRVRYISAGQMQAMVAPLVLDVRSAQSFMSAHMPGAINMSLNAIKARQYWQKKRIVLVDDGWGDLVTEMEAFRLETLGFTDVAILFGGPTAWRAAGGAVEGVGSAAMGLADPAAVLSPCECRHWLVIDISKTPEDCARLFLGCTRIGPPTNGMAAAVAKITEAVNGVTNLTRVAIIDDDGTAALALQSAVKAPPHCTVFAVRGGMKALLERESFNTAITQRSKPGYITPRITLKRTPCGRCL